MTNAVYRMRGLFGVTVPEKSPSNQESMAVSKSHVLLEQEVDDSYFESQAQSGM